MAMRHTIDELHARLVQRGWPDMRPAFGYTLVAAQQRQPLTAGALAHLLGFTKQAASKLIDSMEEVGYVRRVSTGGDARMKLVMLTPRGERLLADVEAIYVEIEAEWAKVIGRKRVEAMRHDLEGVLRSAHGGDLPAVRPTW